MNLTDFGASGGIAATTLPASRNAATTSVPSTGQRGHPPAGQSKVLIVPDIFDPAL